MKKFLTLLALSALAIAGLHAQVEDAPVSINGVMRLLPKQIVSNSQYVFYSCIEHKESAVGKYIIYNKDLELVKEFDLPEVAYVYYSSQEVLADPDGVYFSQSLFNNDDNFEFIIPVKSTDSSLRRPVFIGFLLQNEKGETLQTVDFPNNLFSEYELQFCVLDLGDVKYLNISGLYSKPNPEDNEYYDLMYRINGDGSRVLSLACPPMRVQARPTVAGASEPVTVSFDSDNVSRIEVVSVKGAIADTFEVAPGEHSATIDTSRLGKGMYIINVVENGTRSENCKIIIR